MNLRLVAPELIVDIGGLADLRGIAARDGVLTIGALTRHVDLQKSPNIAAHAPLLADAIGHVAHPAIRNRGTIGGSLAHADPASNCRPAWLRWAAIIVRGRHGERRISAEQFLPAFTDGAVAGGTAGRCRVACSAKRLRAFL
jgi:carbon-monoxide dehydrogenase medium subunit